jgi:hypothetical protein
MVAAVDAPALATASGIRRAKPALSLPNTLTASRTGPRGASKGLANPYTHAQRAKPLREACTGIGLVSGKRLLVRVTCLQSKVSELIPPSAETQMQRIRKKFKPNA